MKRQDLRDFTSEELAEELVERHCGHDDEWDDTIWSVKVEREKLIASYLIKLGTRCDDVAIYPESNLQSNVEIETDEDDEDSVVAGGDSE